MRVGVLGFSAIAVRVEVWVQVWIAAHLGSRSRRQAGETGLGESRFSVGSGSGVGLESGAQVFLRVGSLRPPCSLRARLQKGRFPRYFPKRLISVRVLVNKLDDQLLVRPLLAVAGLKNGLRIALCPTANKAITSSRMAPRGRGGRKPPRGPWCSQLLVRPLLAMSRISRAKITG